MNIRGIITFAFVLVIIVLTVGIVGCEKIVSVLHDDEVPEVMRKEIPIGVVLSLTGKDAEPYGLPMQRGFELAREELSNMQPRGESLTFITVDDESTKAGAIEAVQHLVDQGVPAIVGIAISDYLKEAFPIAQENGVVAFSSISSAAGLSGLGDFIFRAGLASNILIPSGVVATQEKLGYKKVAMIYDIDVDFTSSIAALEKTFEANDVEILTVETFRTGDTDFFQQLTSIMNMEPDALFISALSVEMIQIIVQGREIGIPHTVHFIVPELTTAEVEKAGDAAEGAITFTGWSSMSDTPGNQTFIQKYHAKYGHEPDAWAAQSYTTLYILYEAIKNARSTDAAAIRNALAQTMDFPTILGNFSFDPNGEAVYDPIVLIVKDTEFQIFE